MIRNYKAVLAELARTTDQTRRNVLFIELAAAMENQFSQMNSTLGSIVGAIENDLRHAIADIQTELVALRSLDAERDVLRQRALDARNDIVNQKLHQLSNFLQALDSKLNEQAEVMHQLLFRDDDNAT